MEPGARPDHVTPGLSLTSLGQSSSVIQTERIYVYLQNIYIYYYTIYTTLKRPQTPSENKSVNIIKRELFLVIKMSSAIKFKKVSFRDETNVIIHFGVDPNLIS